MVFVAPNPQPNPKYLAIIRPMTPLVWLVIFASLGVAIMVFVLVSKAEEKVKSSKLCFNYTNDTMN